MNSFKQLPLRSSYVCLSMFAVGSLLSTFGCGASGGGVVSGVVTYNNAPVTVGMVAFSKAGSPAIGGPIAADGTYSLSLPAGEYRIRVDAPSPMPAGWKEGDPLPILPPRPVPESYARFETSGLTLQATGDAQTHDIKMP
ncbi:hypothetical protein [Lacipirellula parvula]|uniref:Carboxypeptidase regulatory-like domain-containing protein n=1 Tax=Lacipirellula parvula TaxID=2650471 RepID=A0A5K7XJA2_9BACT|nr:hypothetical protein [Lacipirellula parvula]BBO35121.1 hypothetical protein PLANPX_4733 [Lacipirellula parvula]